MDYLKDHMKRIENVIRFIKSGVKVIPDDFSNDDIMTLIEECIKTLSKRKQTSYLYKTMSLSLKDLEKQYSKMFLKGE